MACDKSLCPWQNRDKGGQQSIVYYDGAEKEGRSIEEKCPECGKILNHPGAWCPYCGGRRHRARGEPSQLITPKIKQRLEETLYAVVKDRGYRLGALKVVAKDQLYVFIICAPGAEASPEETLQVSAAAEVDAFLNSQGLDIPFQVHLEIGEQQMQAVAASNNRGDTKPVPTKPEYMLERQIAIGGMSEVWLAYREGEPENKYVIKVAHDRYGSLEKCERRLRTEAELLWKFKKQRNIVDIMETFEKQDRIFVVLEFLDGLSLQEIVAEREEGAPEFWVYYWLEQILLAVNELHKENVIHRDINPDNLMLRGEREIVLIDLGVGREAEQTIAGATTIRHGFFSAPEQSRKNAVVHFRSDIYSIGATTYFLLTGEPAPQIMGDAIREDLEKLKIGDQLISFVCQSTMVDPDDRFETVMDSYDFLGMGDPLKVYTEG